MIGPVKTDLTHLEQLLGNVSVVLMVLVPTILAIIAYFAGYLSKSKKM